MSPIPMSHFHIYSDSDFTVSLHGQSSTLWFLPSLAECINANKGDIILAYDSSLPPERTGRGNGAFRKDTFPVYIPASHRLLESYIRSLARGLGDAQERFFLWMMAYMWDYVVDDGLLDPNNLEGRCREFYQGLTIFHKHVSVLLDELKAAFATTNL